MSSDYPHLTLAQVAVEELQDAILSGRLAAGAPLRLEETARSLGMSASPVREALRELDQLGLVVHVPHRGAHVAALSAADLEDTYEMRMLLETKAVEVGAARFGDDDRAAAENALAAYGEALDAGAMRRAREAHAAFHFALYAASGSGWLLRLIRPVWENSERYRFMTLGAAESLRRAHDEHGQILEACAAREPARAAGLLREHLEGTMRRALGLLHRSPLEQDHI